MSRSRNVYLCADFFLRTFGILVKHYQRNLEKNGGVFVLWGIPEISFNALAHKVKELSDLGILAPIQVIPNLFTEFDVDSVPTFIFRDGEKYDKIVGNISLSYALIR